MSNPTVSIVIPVYNRPQFLERALISVEKQSFHDWECIIVDDGSTDNTARVASKFVKQDARFRLILNSHAGEAKATNDGISAAKGTYITLLGSDDEYSVEHLKLRVEELERNPDTDMLHGGLLIIGDEFVPDKRDITKKISLYDPTVYVGGTIFAKQRVFHTLNGFKKMAYASDSDFIERAIDTFKVKKVIWPTYIYHRDQAESATHRL